MPPLTTEHPILVAIKTKGVNSLRQDITVSLEDDGKLKIEVLMLSRTGNSEAQHNHVIPVALFLSSIKCNLERQTDPSTLFSNLCYLYGLDNINYNRFAIVRDYYKQNFSGTITRSMINNQLRIILQDYIVPLIYDSWNSRDGSVFKEPRNRSELGAEGYKIRRLNAQFTQLYNNEKELNSFNDFRTEIQDFIQEYNKNIDIPNNITPQDLPKIIIDVRNYLEVLLNIIENSDKNAFLCDTYDGMTLLKPEVKNWHENVLQLDNFGREFINVHNKLKQKQPFLNEWTTYLQQDQLISSDTGTLTDSGDNTDFASPSRGNRGRRIEYNSKIIQQILVTTTTTKIEVILDTTTIAQRQNLQHIPGTDKLIERINLYLAKQKEDPQHYLVIDCTSSSLVGTAYLAKLHYSNKHKIWKLDLISLVNYTQIKRKEYDYIEEKLQTIDIDIPGAKLYNDLGITSARLEQVVEYAKLRMQYSTLNDNFEQYKQELDAITNALPDSYTNEHYQETKVNTQSLLLSPAHLSSDSDTEFTPLESIDLTIGSDIITRSKSHPSQDLNNPQPSTSGVQLRGRKRTLDAGSQPSLKKACISKSSSRPKRATDSCLFNWEDLDEISTKRAENIDELQIDNKRFLEYLRNSNDQAKNSQLLELVKIKQIENNDNIIGNYKYLLDQVIQDGGYNNYRQNERMQDIAYNLAKNDFSGISANFKNKLINAVGQVQLIRGIHGTIVACQTEGAERDCILSGLDLSYSFLSQPIEDIIVKQGSKFGIKISKNVGQAIPKILGYNTKFVLKILGAKYGTVFLKGAAGGISGVVDIVDIAVSAQALKECSDRAETNNKCSDREIRDNIASITFSGVSFAAGIILTAASAGGPVTIGVTLGLMVSYGIYSGVSAIVEYEKKYDTTDDENWRIFWHNFAFQPLPNDVQHLAARTEASNNIVKTSWHDLNSMPAYLGAYAGGLGKIRLEHVPQKCQSIEILAAYNLAVVAKKNCTPAYTKSYLESSSATIDMWGNGNDDLSRVLPDHINGATMTCLPKVTDAVYEKYGTRRSDSNVIYKCDNSFIIESDLRQNQHNKSIVFNTLLINSGRILTSINGFSSSIFILNDNEIEIYTFTQRNEFVLFSDKFTGSITVGVYGSVNIFNTEQLLDEIVICYIKEHWKTQTDIIINGRPIKFSAVNDDYATQIQYHGRKHKEDHIICESPDNESNSTNIFVDSGGGFNDQRPDRIKNCKKAIIWPHTKVEGNNGTYIFYIKIAGYEKQNSSSEINIIGKGTIIFLETALLKDCEDITYSEADNTISLRIKLGENIFYRLDIKNYLDKGSKVSNFNLIDKYGSNIVLKIEQGATIINKFGLNIEKDIHDSDANDISVVKRYYRKISDKKINYELFGNVKYKERHYHFGSDAKDIIKLDKHTQFVQGGEESDIYFFNMKSWQND